MPLARRRMRRAGVIGPAPVARTAATVATAVVAHGVSRRADRREDRRDDRRDRRRRSAETAAERSHRPVLEPKIGRYSSGLARHWPPVGRFHGRCHDYGLGEYRGFGRRRGGRRSASILGAAVALLCVLASCGTPTASNPPAAPTTAAAPASAAPTTAAAPAACADVAELKASLEALTKVMPAEDGVAALKTALTMSRAT